MVELKQHIPEFLLKHLTEIRGLCKIHKVKSLWAFGSVLGSSFSRDSDVDFLYEMDEQHIVEEESYFCFWGFYDTLHALLDRPIDMVWYKSIKNPYFKEEVKKTKVLIYEKDSQEAPV